MKLICMKYNLVLEIINDTKRFENFKKTIYNLSTNASELIKKDKKIPYANNTLTWRQIIVDYHEFVNELEKYRDDLHKSNKYNPKGCVRFFKKLLRNKIFDDWLNGIGYEGNYITAAELAPIIYNFFTSDKYTKEKFNQSTIDLLNQTNDKLKELLNSQPSIKTKE